MGYTIASYSAIITSFVLLSQHALLQRTRSGFTSYSTISVAVFLPTNGPVAGKPLVRMQCLFGQGLGVVGRLARLTGSWLLLRLLMGLNFLLLLENWQTGFSWAVEARTLSW